MIKNPIQNVTNNFQNRAIGIVNGIYKPDDLQTLNKGTLIGSDGFNLDAVVLGKALPLLKKYVDFEKNYFWIVYPRNKTSDVLHIQISGLWDPCNFGDHDSEDLKKDPEEVLKELNLKNNYFSIRGKLIYVNTPQKEFIVKITPSKSSKVNKNKPFKLIIKGDIKLDFLNSFISIDVRRLDNTLVMESFEVIKSN